MGIVSFNQKEPSVNYENFGVQLLNRAGAVGNYNTKVFESTEMREKLQEEIFFPRHERQVGVN